jgi:hypothetical protein
MPCYAIPCYAVLGADDLDRSDTRMLRKIAKEAIP